jgi:hypothetical protein
MTTPNKDRTRVYRVRANPKFPDGGLMVDRLIRAPHRAMALQHVARTLFEVHIARAEDFEELMPNGVKVERYDPHSLDEHPDELHT